MAPNVIISKATRSLVVPRTGAITNMFPEAHHLGDKLVIGYGPREAMLMNRLGYKVPPPIGLFYNWCGGTPFKVQVKTAALLTSNTRAYVLNDMGTGKTRAALWAWDYLHGNGVAGKMLVVAPLSTLNFVWAREIFAVMPHRKCAVLHGTKAHRLEMLNSDADIYIINHDGLKTVHAELSARTDIDTLLIDELAVYRNNSNRSKLMRKFAARFTWIWGMTGRPIPNEPTDVWGQAQIVTPHTVPKRQTHCRDMLMTQVSAYIWKPRPNATELAFAMLQPSVRFSLDDVVELPEKIERTVDIELSPSQKAVYKKLVVDFHAKIADKQITAMNAGAAMNKLLQVAAGWVYTGGGEYLGLDNQPRLDMLLDLIESASRKVIVFATFRSAVTEIGNFLEANKIRYASVHGGVPARDREDIFNGFQNTDLFKVLVAHPGCISHGLTLTAADTTIWYSPTASLETYEQANARTRRVGQKHKQIFFHFQSTGVEKRLYSLLRQKQKVQDDLLTLLEEATGAA